MKLSTFKATYLPWSDEYKARKAGEQRARDAYWAERLKEPHREHTFETKKVTSHVSKTTSKRKPLPYSYPTPKNTAQGGSHFGSGMLMGALIGNVVSNAFSGRSHTHESPASVEREKSSSVFSSNDTTSDWGSSGSNDFDA